MSEKEQWDKFMAEQQLKYPNMYIPTFEEYEVFKKQMLEIDPDYFKVLE
jgi:hypothetical protein